MVRQSSRENSIKPGSDAHLDSKVVTSEAVYIDEIKRQAAQPLYLKRYE